jgi:hypothetical protein
MSGGQCGSTVRRLQRGEGAYLAYPYHRLYPCTVFMRVGMLPVGCLFPNSAYFLPIPEALEKQTPLLSETWSISWLATIICSYFSIQPFERQSSFNSLQMPLLDEKI